MHTIKGTTNAMDFYDFLTRLLLPVLGQYPYKNSVIILDNARIHQKEQIFELAALMNFKCVFLPPYTPELNPIEFTYGWLKQRLRRNHDLVKEMLQIGVPLEQILMEEYVNITASMCQNWIRHCGY